MDDGGRRGRAAGGTWAVAAAAGGGGGIGAPVAALPRPWVCVALWSNPNSNRERRSLPTAQCTHANGRPLSAVRSTPQIAVEGCCHGDLDQIYATMQAIEARDGVTIDALLCCGDFQARVGSGAWQGGLERAGPRLSPASTLQPRPHFSPPFLFTQAVRNLDDLECLACPPKYRAVKTFYKYYSGEAVAPYPTIFSACRVGWGGGVVVGGGGGGWGGGGGAGQAGQRAFASRPPARPRPPQP